MRCARPQRDGPYSCAWTAPIHATTSAALVRPGGASAWLRRRSRIRSLRRTLMPLADGIDGVGFDRRLVAVRLDAREPQGEPPRVLRALLDLVERDLHDQFGTHIHGVIVTSDLARKH